MFNVHIWLILFIIASIVLTVYYLIYTKNINQRVCGENQKGIRMLDFPKAVISVIILFLLSLCVTNALIPASATTALSRNNYAVIDTSDYSYLGYSSNYALDDASFAKLFQKDENTGYMRKETQNGDFNFIVFTSTTPSDAFHPDFLCYATYTGDTTKIKAISQNGQFQNIHTKQKEGTSSIGDFTNHTLLFIGNYDDESQFTLTLGIYDETGYEHCLKSTTPEKVMEDFAFSKVSVIIKKCNCS